MLADYLATEQAREDVRKRLETAQGIGDEPWTRKISGVGELAITGTNGPFTKLCVWKKINEDEEDDGAEYILLCAAYFCPDGDRYIVTDLGEGVRALRLKGCDLSEVRHHVSATMAEMWLQDQERDKEQRRAFMVNGLIEGEIGTVGTVTTANLPDAICRVMLASLRVAGVGR